jgi:hypothetical protein
VRKDYDRSGWSNERGFFPFGLAVDGKRGLIYLANGLGNSISGYSTSGTAATTIK